MPSDYSRAKRALEATATAKDAVGSAEQTQSDYPVTLPIKNASFVIAGMTRSGKGVGAANIAAGAALDAGTELARHWRMPETLLAIKAGNITDGTPAGGAR